MRRLLLIGLFGLAAGGGLWGLLPSAPDAQTVETLLRDRAWGLFGRRLTVTGPIVTRLFPKAGLSVEGVVLHGPEGATAPTVELAALEVDLDGWALMDGEIVVEDVTLVSPRIVLEVLPDGRASWLNHPPPSAAAGQIVVPPRFGAAPGATTGAGSGTANLPLPSRTGIGLSDRASADEPPVATIPGATNIVALPPEPLTRVDLAAMMPTRFSVENAVVVYRNIGRGTTTRFDDLDLTARRHAASAAYRVDLTAAWNADPGGIDARGDPAPLTVPLAVAGIVGLPRTAPDGTVSTLLEVDLTTPMVPGRLRFDGTANRGEVAPALAGRLRLDSADPGTILAALPTNRRSLGEAPLVLPGALGGVLRAEAAVEATGDRVDLDQLSVSIGPVKLGGGLSIGFPTVDFGRDVTVGGDLVIRQLDLDKLAAMPERTYRRRQSQQAEVLARLYNSPESAAEGGVAIPLDPAVPSLPAAPVSAFDTIAAGVGASGRMLIPGMVRGAIEVAIDTTLLRGRPIRDIRLQLGLRDGLIGVDRASALLPGGTDVTLFGQISRPVGSPVPVFSGNLQGGSTRLRETLDWLGFTVNVPARRLMHAEFTGTVEASISGIQLDSIDLLVDDQQAIGRLAWLRGDRASIHANLAFNELNLDPYLVGPPYRPNGATAATVGGGALLAVDPDNVLARLSNRLRNDDGDTVPPPQIPGAGFDSQLPTLSGRTDDPPDGVPGLSIVRPGSSAARPVSLLLLEAMDLRLDLRAASVIWRGEQSRQVRVAGTLRRGEIRLSEARVAGYAGSTLVLTGALTNLLGRPRFDGRFSLTAPEAGPLLQSANLPVGVRIGALELDGTAAGELRELDIAARLSLAGMGGTLSGRVLDIDSAPRYDLLLDLGHPDMGTFVQAIGLIDAPSPVQMGPLRISGRAAGTAAGGTLALEAALFGGMASLTGQLALDGGFRYAGRFEFQHEDTNRFIHGIAPSLDEAAERTGPLRLAGRLIGDRTGLEFNDINATIGRTPVTGDMAVGFARVEPLLLANLRLGEIDTAQLFDERWVETGGRMRRSWPAYPVNLEWVRRFEGQFQIAADAITHRGYRLSDVDLLAVLRDDMLEIGSLTGRLMGGPMQLTGSIQPAQVNLVAAATDTRMASRLGRDLGVSLRGGLLSFDLALSARGVTLAEFVRSLSGSILFELSDTELVGVDAGRLAVGLKRVASPDSLTGLVRRGFDGDGDSGTRLGTVAAEMAIDNGVVAPRQFVFVSDAMEGRVQGTIDVGRLRQDLSIDIALNDPEDVPFFTIGLAGATAGPNRTYDLDLLTRYLFGVESAPVINPPGARPAPDAPPRPAPSAEPVPRILDGLDSGRDLLAENVGLVPPGSTAPLSANDDPVQDPDFPLLPSGGSTGEPQPLPEPLPPRDTGRAPDPDRPPPLTASIWRQPSATIELPQPAARPRAPATEGQNRSLRRQYSGDALTQQLIRRSRADDRRLPPTPALNLNVPRPNVPEFGPAVARPPTGAVERAAETGPGPLPLPGDPAHGGSARREAQAVADESEQRLFTVEPFPDGGDASGAPQPVARSGLATPGGGTLSAFGSGALASPGGGASGEPILLAPPRAVSVPTEMAGNETGVGTQWNSAVPRLNNRGKRSSGRAGDVPDEPDALTVGGPTIEDFSGRNLPLDVEMLPLPPKPKPPVTGAIRASVERGRAALRTAQQAGGGQPPIQARPQPGGARGLSSPGLSLFSAPLSPTLDPAPDTPALATSDTVGPFATSPAQTNPAPAAAIPDFGNPRAATDASTPATLAPPGGQSRRQVPVTESGSGPRSTPSATGVTAGGRSPYGDLTHGGAPVGTAIPTPGPSRGAPAGIGAGGLTAPGGAGFGALPAPDRPSAGIPDLEDDSVAFDNFFVDPQNDLAVDVPEGPITLPAMPWQTAPSTANPTIAAPQPAFSQPGVFPTPAAEPVVAAPSGPAERADPVPPQPAAAPTRAPASTPAPASSGGLAPPGGRLAVPGGAQ